MLTERWVRLYTSGLPDELRHRRLAEIASDVFEQYADSAGTVRRAVVGRTVRGAVDDLVRRREVARGMASIGVRRVLTQAWWAPVAVLIGLFDVALAVGVLADEESTMPGRVVGPALVLLAAAALATGLVVRLRGTHTGGRGGIRLVALAIAAAVLVSLVLGGPVVLVVAALVVVASVVALMQGSVRNAAVTDTLVLIGTLPALAMFWFVAPAVLALVVIVGVLTSRPRTAVAPA